MGIYGCRSKVAQVKAHVGARPASPMRPRSWYRRSRLALAGYSSSVRRACDVAAWSGNAGRLRRQKELLETRRPRPSAVGEEISGMSAWWPPTANYSPDCVNSVAAHRKRNDHLELFKNPIYRKSASRVPVRKDGWSERCHPTAIPVDTRRDKSPGDRKSKEA